MYTHEYAHGNIVRISFDARKRVRNLRTHGLDLADAGSVLTSELAITFEDRRFEYEEPRYITLGPLAETIVVVVTVEHDTTARIISMRKAKPHGKAIYYEQFH